MLLCAILIPLQVLELVALGRRTLPITKPALRTGTSILREIAHATDGLFLQPKHIEPVPSRATPTPLQMLALAL
jgi:hypothetical protein